jgi:hypothetical protein
VSAVSSAATQGNQPVHYIAGLVSPDVSTMTVALTDHRTIAPARAQGAFMAVWVGPATVSQLDITTPAGHETCQNLAALFHHPNDVTARLDCHL